ncbi:hypothetical protein C1646_692728 [Rhizophagus diaphanus]|nr:hypothetical protein C1646_692728 [Rhizophagus diaphanus] [Rhizophagus sp. MUCL 43196]
MILMLLIKIGKFLSTITISDIYFFVHNTVSYIILIILFRIYIILFSYILLFRFYIYI